MRAQRGHQKGFPPVSFPESANFLRCMFDENDGLWKGPVLIVRKQRTYCIAFQITNQDHLRIGPFQSLRFCRACSVRSQQTLGTRLVFREPDRFVHELTDHNMTAVVCPANQQSTIKNKSPQTFAHLVNFSNRCAMLNNYKILFFLLLNTQTFCVS